MSETSKINDGGPVFPCPVEHCATGMSGMSVRTWMVGMLMPTIHHEWHESNYKRERYIKDAIQMADEAIKQLGL